MGRPRKDQTRAVEARKAEMREMPQAGYESNTYIPSGIIPQGMSYRWIRLSTLNEPDHGNWSTKTRRGWKPVPRERHLDIWPYIPMPGHNTDSAAIINGGLILCEIPTHYLKAQKDQQERDTADAMNSIAWTTEGLHGAPTVNESGKVQTGHAAFKSE